MKIAIGELLLSRLDEAGVKHIFGVPGDFNLELMQQLEDRNAPRWIGNCNELNAAYAADGYARIAGLSALIVTHGVGALSALNGIAGAYSEHVPVICICGSIPRRSTAQGLLMHHTLADGTRDEVLHAFRKFTVAQAQLTPQNAAAEIDRVILAAWREKRPVYLELPSDIAFLQVEAPSQALQLVEPGFDGKSVDACVQRILARLRSAKRPAILLDLDADRFQVLPEVQRLAEKAQLPVATTGTCKGSFSEEAPLFVGSYAGAASAEAVRTAVEESDCLLAIGYRRVDAVSGFFSDHLPTNTIYLGGYSADILAEHFEGITLRAVLERVIEEVPASQEQRIYNNSTPNHSSSSETAVLTQPSYWEAVQTFLRPGDIVIAEDGTSSSGSGHLRLPKDCTYITQAIWGSIGYSVGCLLGTLLAAPDRRSILLVGDGAFQLTAQEISTVLRHELSPCIFLINNCGYTIERTILGRHAKYNDVANWSYADLPRVFARREVASRVVRTNAELSHALGHADGSFLFLEVLMDPDDAPLGLIKGGHASADLDYGARGPQHEPDAQIPIR